MTTLINNLTGDVAGVQITNANSAGGGDAFNETDTPQTTTGGDIVYGTAASASGTIPAMVTTTGSTSGPQRRGWQVNPTNSTGAQFAVFYFNRSEIVGSNFFPLRGMNIDSTSQRMMVHATSGGLVHLRNSLNTNVWSSPVTLSTNTRYRVEVMWGGTTASTAQVKIFVEESDTPVVDSGLLTDINFGGTTQSVWFGQTSSTTNNSGKLSGRVGWSDSNWIGPLSATPPEPGLLTHLATGIPTPSSVTVSQKWNNASGKTFRIIASASSDLSNPIIGTSGTLDSKGWIKMTVTGLTANTQYYGGVQIDGITKADGRFQFKTAPFPGDGVSHSILFGSCRWTNGGDESFIAMKQIHDAAGLIHGKAVFLADMGDNGYPDWGLGGGTVTEDMVLDHYVTMANFVGIQDTLRAIPWGYWYDNHDTGGDPSDKNGSWRTPVLAAYKRAVPHRTLVASSGAIFQSFDWGRVRYIAPDNRAERDAETDPITVDKLMWSKEQEDWFIDQVATWPWAICVLGGIYFRHDAESGGRWGSYWPQFERINDRLNAVDSLRRLVWLAGDRHALAADLGVSPTTRGVPQAVGAPFEQGSVDLPNNEPWVSGGTTSYYNITPNQNMRAYGEASFTDDGGDTIVFNYVGRQSSGGIRVTMTKNLDVSPRVRWYKPPRI